MSSDAFVAPLPTVSSVGAEDLPWCAPCQIISWDEHSPGMLILVYSYPGYILFYKNGAHKPCAISDVVLACGENDLVDTRGRRYIKIYIISGDIRYINKNLNFKQTFVTSGARGVLQLYKCHAGSYVRSAPSDRIGPSSSIEVMYAQVSHTELHARILLIFITKPNQTKPNQTKQNQEVADIYDINPYI
jgi:hypothetical protein